MTEYDATFGFPIAFEQEKLTYEHDFTVWTGDSEFYPLVEPRNFVPTYLESFYAPGYGTWYQYGGLHDNPASHRPNAIGATKKS